jgi:hypothetical protein
MPGGQANAGTIFIIIVAVIFLVIVIGLGIVGLVNRRRSGHTLKNSTFGNAIEGDQVTPTNRSYPGEPSGAGVNDDSHPGSAPQNDTAS